MVYNFDMEVAEEYGVNEAIMISNLQFWINKNKANKSNFYDGHYWTYNSVSAFCELFPFWTRHQIEYILSKLTEKGVLMTGNYHENKSNRSKWYAFVDEEKWLLKDNCKNGKTPENCILKNSGIIQENSEMYIYDTDNKPDNKLKEEKEEYKEEKEETCCRTSNHHQPELEKGLCSDNFVFWSEFNFFDDWIKKFIDKWNDLSKKHQNWQYCDYKTLTPRMKEVIKQRAKEFYIRYKPRHPEMTEDTLLNDLIDATEWRFDNSVFYKGETKSQFRFSIYNIFQNTVNWNNFLDCTRIDR